MRPVTVSRDDVICQRLLQFLATHVTCDDGRVPQGSFTLAHHGRDVAMDVRCTSCGARFVRQVSVSALGDALRAATQPRRCLQLVLGASQAGLVPVDPPPDESDPAAAQSPTRPSDGAQ